MSEMAKFICFSMFVGKKKKDKGHDKLADLIKRINGNRAAPLKREIPAKILPIDGIHEEMLSNEYPLHAEAVETDYEGGDEHDEKFSIKRDFSDYDLQAHVTDGVEEKDPTLNGKIGGLQDHINADANDNDRSDAEAGMEFMIQSGHASDPGIGRAEFWASPMLQRSCSNIETSQVLRKIANQLPPSKSHSYEDLENLKEKMAEEVVGHNRGSPLSVMTPCSADRVMLKKHSSSQVLPSRSRKLWWKLFLWSHRNLHKSKMVKPRPLAIVNLASDQKGGYCSDTLEPMRGKETSELELGGSCSRENKVRSNQDPDNFHDRVSGLWPSRNQWLAFSTDPASLTRMWIDSLEVQPLPLPDEEDTGDECIFFPPSPDGGLSLARSVTHKVQHSQEKVSEDVLQANNVIQSLNFSSTVAHIAGMNLKVIPTISSFSSLRSVNLSGNFIVRISSGSLPKGLQTLNLSRNKIATIEGLRELTRLRVLDLSYNRISRIGHGLSNCTLIKELYLAGNKISEVEGLHRLLKLIVLDLSFNKIATTKALGQLVANYNSLLALNLLGNPIQSNIGDDQLRKVVPGLLPQLTYLNKQPIKPQRAREATIDSVAKAAIGGSGMTHRRKVQKRVSQGGGSSTVRGRSDTRNGLRSGLHTSKSRKHRHASSTKRL